MQTLQRHHHRTSLTLFSVSIILFSLTLQVLLPAPTQYSHPLQPKTSLLSATSIPNATIAVTPPTTNDPCILTNDCPTNHQSTLIIHITIDNGTSPIQINGYEVLIQYNNKVLKATTLDYSNSILVPFSGTINLVSDCIDGTPSGPGNPPPASYCGAGDSPGIVHFAAQILSATTNTLTNGELFTLTFSVIGIGGAEIQIQRATLGNGQVDSNGVPISVPDHTLDGFYTDLGCGGVACVAPSVDFKFSPQPAKQATPTVFNATASATNPSDRIAEYFWQWSDPGAQTPYTDICAYAYESPSTPHPACQLNPHQGCLFGTPDPVTRLNSTSTKYCIKKGDNTPLNNTAVHIFISTCAGVCTVTLTVKDVYNITASKSYAVHVINADIDVGIDSIVVTPNPVGQQAGQVFTVTAVVKNYGGVPVNDTSCGSVVCGVTLTLVLAQPILLKTVSFEPNKPLKPSESRTIVGTWDSTNHPANIYRVDAFAQYVVNATSGKIDESKISNNLKSTWIQLIYPSPTGLNLLGTTTVGIVVAGGLGYGVSWVRKARRKVEE